MSILRAKTWIDIPNGVSISELIDRNAKHIHPEKTIYEEAFTGRTISYGDFRRQVRCGAYWLQNVLGLKEGQTVAISGQSCIDYILGVHSVWWAGGVVALINYSLHKTELAKALGIVKPDYLLVDNTLYQKIPDILRLSGTRSDLTILTFGEPHASWPSFPQEVATTVTEAEPYSLAGVDSHNVLCAILLSSGTTGRPKAVMLSHRNIVAAIMQLRADNPSNWRPSQREIFFPPLSHVYALYVCMTGVFWIGAYVCLMPRFHLETFCRLMHEREATLARLVPPIAKQLAEGDVVARYTYPKLEYFSCSAAPLKLETAEKLSKRFPHVALCQTYGATELSGPCVQSGIRNLDLPLSAAGTLIANTEMVFLQDDGVHINSRGPGEITVRGPNIMMGYKDDKVATNETILPGGWCRTGDLGYIDENGFLIIFDRLKDIIKYNGFQVSPAELEEVILRHPLVDEVAVCGIWNDAAASDLARAYVVPVKSAPITRHSEITQAAQSIIDFVAGRVSNYKQLKGGVVFVEALPKNPTGKILRRVLQAQEQQGSTKSMKAKL